MAIISSKSDYHYCDLSGWSSNVGSDIYPLRSDDQKRLLKACDIAFIYEAMLSRYCAFAGITWNGSAIDTTADINYKKYKLLDRVLYTCPYINVSFKNFFISTPDVFSQTTTYYDTEIFIQETLSATFSASGQLLESNIKEAFNKPATSSRQKDSGIYYFKTYQYAAKRVSVTTSGATYSMEQWGNVDWGSPDSIQYVSHTQKSGGENGYFCYQTSPIYSLELAEPAKSAVEVEVYAIVYLYPLWGAKNDDEPSSYLYVDKLTSQDGEACSRRWIEKAKTIWRGIDKTGSVTHSLELGAYVSKIYLVVKFKEDIDY